MATNPYSYGSLGQRWTVGEPTSKSLLDISRVKNDANRWTLEQLIPDPDTTQTLGFDLSFNSSDQRLLQIYNTDASNYFQIFGGRAASSTSDHLVFSTGTNGTIMEFDGANHWITFHDTAGVQKMYYRGDGSPGLILEPGVGLIVGGTATFSGLISGNGGAEIGSNTAKVKFYSDANYSGIYNGSSLTSDESYYFGSGDHFWYSDGSVSMKLDNGDLAVDTDTLFVDASADRVGINTATPGAALDVAHTGTSAAFRVYNSQATNPFGILIDNTGANLSDSNYVADFRVGGYSILKLNNSGQMAFAPNSYGGVSAGNLTVKTGSINSDSIRLEAGGTTSTWLESRGYLGHSWYVDSTRSMTLDSTGLGVGTASPSALAHLYSDSSGANTELRIEHNNASGTATAMMRFKRAGADFAYVGGAATAISGASTTDLGLTVPSGKNIVFATDNTERARILSSGGITFNGDTSQNNALSDFEIGTWTPTILGGTTNPTISTYAVQSGKYTKIGDIVHLEAYVLVTQNNLSGGAGGIQIGGLPFTFATYGFLLLGYSTANGDLIGELAGHGQPRAQQNSGSTLTLYGSNAFSPTWGSANGNWQFSFSGTLKIA